MTVRSYSSPEAFKQALEHNLRSSSSDGRDFARRRQLLVYERFLARIEKEFSDAAILKGGIVLELRLSRARTTKDVDLRMIGSPGELLPQLQRAGRLELGDFMSFEILPDATHPEIHNEGMLYEGYRFRAECKISNKVYGSIFGVDVSFGVSCALRYMGDSVRRDGKRKPARLAFPGAGDSSGEQLLGPDTRRSERGNVEP